jgi:large subunit ribosomal protein L19
MGKIPLIEEIEQEQMKKEIPHFRIGDTLRVQTRIVEGDKERIQAFTGTVIARKGRGISETVSLYRVAYGSAMERVFLLHSPKVAGIEKIRAGKVRRAKLYYLRGTSGKAAKVKPELRKKKTKEKPEGTQAEQVSGEESSKQSN